jgi:hypothetical protein
VPGLSFAALEMPNPDDKYLAAMPGPYQKDRIIVAPATADALRSRTAIAARWARNSAHRCFD